MFAAALLGSAVSWLSSCLKEKNVYKSSVFRSSVADAVRIVKPLVGTYMFPCSCTPKPSRSCSKVVFSLLSVSSEGVTSGAQPHLLSVPELCHCLAESWVTFRLYLQELLQYKRQNPAKVSWRYLLFPAGAFLSIANGLRRWRNVK